MASDDLHDLVDTYEKDEDYQPINAYLHGFVQYYKGDLSKGTIVQYLRFLAELDFDPLADDPQPDLLEDDDFHLGRFHDWARAKARRKFGKAEDDKDSRIRDQYMSYLALKKYLKMADPNRIQHLPETRDIKKPDSNSKDDSLSENQIEEIIMATENRKQFISIALLYYAGLRSYELLHLTPEWLEFQQDETKITIPPKYAKGQRDNKEKEVTILKKVYEDDLKQHIKNYYGYEGDYSDLLDMIAQEDQYEPVFNFVEDADKSYKSLMRERYHLNQMIKKAAKRAGINNDVASHTFRRSFINTIYDSTKDLSRTAQSARHKNTATTEGYLDRSTEEKIKTYHKAFG